jgi:non-heme chloroperoxidase
MDTYAADVAELVAALDLKNAIHVGHSTGGGEVARYVARYGKGRVAKAVLISSVPPVMVKSDKNPGGLPIEVFDNLRRQLAANRAQSSTSTWPPAPSTASTGRARRCQRAPSATGGARA